MKRIIAFLLVLFMILCLSGCNDSTDLNRTDNKLGPEEMLKTGKIDVDLMELGLPTVEERDRLTELTQKFQAGISAHQDWIMEYIKDYEGEALPYHPNFGMSEEEYNEYLQLEKELKFYKTADAVLEIEKTGDRQYKFTQKEGLNLIDNIVIDFAQNTVSTSYGVCKYDGEISPSEHQAATGRWYGYSWKLQDIKDTTNYKSIQFNLGQLEESKKIIIYYEVKISDSQQPINDFEVINYSL